MFKSFLLFLTLVSIATANEFIIGGMISDTTDWPEVVKISPVGCTGSLIGPRTLLTAAHCANSPNQTFMLKGIKYNVALKRPSAFGGGFLRGQNFNYDIAVGLIDKEVTGVEFARIGQELQVGMPVRMVGYGCTNIKSSDYGTLHEGASTVTGIGVGDFTTRGTSNVCYGDSGGALWDARYLPAKIVVGIVSRTDGRGTESYFTRVNYKPNFDFVRKFADDNETAICDVNVTCL